MDEAYQSVHLLELLTIFAIPYATRSREGRLHPPTWLHLFSILLFTGPPTHSVGGRLLTAASVCRRRLSSPVTLHGGFTCAGKAMTSCSLQSNYRSTVTLHGGPVVLRPVGATPCLEFFSPWPDCIPVGPFSCSAAVYYDRSFPLCPHCMLSRLWLGFGLRLGLRSRNTDTVEQADIMVCNIPFYCRLSASLDRHSLTDSQVAFDIAYARTASRPPIAAPREFISGLIVSNKHVPAGRNSAKTTGRCEFAATLTHRTKPE